MLENIWSSVLFFFKALWTNLKMIFATLWAGLKPKLEGVDVFQAIGFVVATCIIVLKPELAMLTFGVWMLIYSVTLIFEMMRGVTSMAEKAIIPAAFLPFIVSALEGAFAPMMVVVCLYGLFYQLVLANFFEGRVKFHFTSLIK